jgi:hypothetical protein
MMAKILFVGRGEGTEVGTTVGEMVGDGLMRGRLELDGLTSY